MKAKLRPTRHGKFSTRRAESVDRKMRLVHELFLLNGAELDNGDHVPEVKIVNFHGNQRRFVLDRDGQPVVYINKDLVFSRDLDYIVLCALCFYFTETKKHMIKGGTVTMVDIHSCIDLSSSFAKDVAVKIAKGATASVITSLLIRTLR